MRNRINIVVGISILFILSGSQLFAQSAYELYLELNESSYKMLVSNSGERGISTDEFAKWFVDNGRLSVKAEKMNESSGKLLMYVVGEKGLLGKNSYQIIMSDRPVSLSRMMNGRQLAGDLDRYFPDTLFFPGDSFFPGDHFFPGDSFIRSDREIEQMAVEAGRKALSSMRSTDGSGLSIVMFAVPEKFDPNDRISAVPAVVAGRMK